MNPCSDGTVHESGQPAVGGRVEEGADSHVAVHPYVYVPRSYGEIAPRTCKRRIELVSEFVSLCKVCRIELLCRNRQYCSTYGYGQYKIYLFHFVPVLLKFCTYSSDYAHAYVLELYPLILVDGLSRKSAVTASFEVKPEPVQFPDSFHVGVDRYQS